MTNAPAGWYTDPSSPGHEHWWDGTQYTTSRPVAQQQPVQHQPQYQQPQYQAQPQYTQPQGVVQYQPHAVAYVPVRLAGVSPKSRTVASLLSFFLGGFGVDRFYMGNIGMGVAKLLLGWLTAGIWPLIDFIVIVAGASHDGQGLAVTEWN